MIRARIRLLLVVNGAAVALLLARTLALEAKKVSGEEEPLDPGSSINDVCFFVKPLIIIIIALVFRL